MRLFGPYYYGKHKWENYLLDIQDAIKSEETAIQGSGRLEVKTFEAVSQQNLAEMREQTEQMRHIDDTLQSGFEELRAEFEWGFTLMVDRMDTMIDNLTQLAAKLDAIHKTLQSPLLTQARELFQLGQEHFRKGLLDKALEAYLKAEEKNEVDFPLQLQIGKLYLYGRDEDDDVIDLPKAEKHLVLAARYADAEKTTFPQWNGYCGQAYFHAAVAAYLIGEQEQAAGRADATRACLERALGYLTKAAILWPRFTEILYTQAKCHALLGQVADATRKLEILSDRDRRYFERASRDGDFKSFLSDINEVFNRAIVSPGPLASAIQIKLVELTEAVSWAKRSIPISQEDLAIVDSVVTDPSVARYMSGADTSRLKELPTRQKIQQVTTIVEAIAHDLAFAKRSISTLDVDIEGLNDRLAEMRAQLEKIAIASFNGMVYACDQLVQSTEQRRTGCENLIREEKQSMKVTSGAGIGCLFFFLFMGGSFFVISVAANLLVAIAPDLRNALQSAGGGTVGFCMFGIGIVGAIVGSKISRDYKNRPHRLKIEEYSNSIAECTRKLPGLNSRADVWKEETLKFCAWQAAGARPSTREAATAR